MGSTGQKGQENIESIVLQEASTEFHICARVAIVPRQGSLENIFSTLLGEKDNEPAASNETMNKFENIIDEKWITNDNKLFERAVSIEALKKAWYMQKSKPGMMTKGSSGETLNRISDQWFITANKKLLDGSFGSPHPWESK